MKQSYQNFISYLGDGILFHAVNGFLVFVFVLILGRILKFLLNTLGRKIIARTESDLDDKVLEIVLDRIMSVAAITGMYVGMLQLQSGLPRTHTTFHSFIEYANGALFVLMGIVLTAAAIRITDTVVRHTLHGVAEREGSNFDQALAPLINRMVNIFIVAVGFIVVLEHFGQNISTLLVSLGVGSLAVALAAQDTLSNMIAGFVIMIDRPFRSGDRVKLPTGEEGDIYEIGVRSTKILDFDNNLLIVPNNELIKTRIVNSSYPESAVRIVVDVAVLYGTDAEKVKALLRTAAVEHPLVLKSPVPEAYLMKFGEYALQFRLSCRVASLRDQFPTTEMLRMKIYDAFQRAGISFATPQQTVTISEKPVRESLQAPRHRKKV
jgi:small-conductance mechanosensitive channel